MGYNSEWTIKNVLWALTECNTETVILSSGKNRRVFKTM